MDIILTNEEKTLIEEWKNTIYNTSRKFTDDEYNFREDDELNWFELCFGWLLGKGVDEIRANSLAIYMRYNLEIA